jgi:predicted SnoaL-like aldol condensation-catalyzing enzyme
METARLFATRYYELLAEGDVERLAMLYADDGEIVRYDGVAKGADQLTAYYRSYLERTPGIKLLQIEQLRRADDVLLWDATLDSDVGTLQTVEVMILDEDGRIARHIPGFRGYWGR